jgi:hypothetical protein
MNTTKPIKKSYFRQTANAAILAGIVILLIGIYYCVIKAGIPYQDPPLELQIQYAINMGIGEILVRDGFLISTCGGITRFLITLISKKKQRI